MVCVDAIQEVVDLLKANWNNVNTSSKTPNIDKIINVPMEMNYMDGLGYVLVYSIAEDEEHPGIGATTHADVRETIRIDIRVLEDETYFNEVRCEIKRILFSNIVNPTANFCNINIDNQTITNLSNRNKKYYREVREIEMVAYNRNMVA